MAEYFEFKDVRLSDYRGRLNAKGKIWTHLAHLGAINTSEGKQSFYWSVKQAAKFAECREEEGARLMAAAALEGIVTRRKVRVGDKIMWEYAEGEAAYALYRSAALCGLVEPVNDEGRADLAEQVALKHDLSALDHYLFIQLARKAVDGVVVTTTRALAEEMTRQMRFILDEEDYEVPQKRIVRALARLSDRRLIVPRKDAPTRKSCYEVPLPEEPGEDVGDSNS